MGVKLAHAHGRRGHRAVAVAEEDGRRSARWAPTTTTPPAIPTHSRSCASSFDLILNTVSATIDLDAYLRSARASTARWSLVGVPEQPACEVGAFPLVAAGAAVGGLDDRRHRRDPGDARLLRRARHRAPKSSSSRPIRSTRPTSGCSPATSATASSSTSQHCEASSGYRHAITSAASPCSSSGITSLTSIPANGQPAAASVAATRMMSSRPGSLCVVWEMKSEISSRSIGPSASADATP